MGLFLVYFGLILVIFGLISLFRHIITYTINSERSVGAHISGPIFLVAYIFAPQQRLFYLLLGFFLSISLSYAALRSHVRS